jgi:UDP-N-acetyl-D-mannosaminuronic acid dehydrogenase
MNICVIGLGYIGLPTAAFLATSGFRVHGVDVDVDVVAMVNRGSAKTHEPDLDVLVKSAVNSGNLIATTTPIPADVFLIAVPTPLGEDHTPDLSNIESATKAIAPHLASGDLIILESTCPVGATEDLARNITHQRPDLRVAGNGSDSSMGKPIGDQIFVAHCPERVLPGQILHELVCNDRVVGGVDEDSTERAAAFYEQFVRGRVLRTDARTAELAKLAENTFRDVNIAFANELSSVCGVLAIDVWNLIDLANCHPRVNILMPGPGVGGHCIAVDPWFIVSSAPSATSLIPAARYVNDSVPEAVVQRVLAATESVAEPRIACLGLSFKPDVDDLRLSPAIKVVQSLGQRNLGEILVVEPHIETLPAGLQSQGQVKLIRLDEALERANIVVALVKHRSFSVITPADLQGAVVIDTVGMLPTVP